MTNELLLERYRAALKEIATLANVTEIRGGLYDMFTPEHLIKEGGWVPLPPGVKRGLEYAADIARQALT